MKKLLTLLMAIILSFSLVYDVSAKGGRNIKSGTGKGTIKKTIKLDTILPESNAGKDCQFLYILKDNSLNKHSLPDLKLVLSVNLPPGDVGIAVDVGGDCPSTTKTILVRADNQSNSNEEVLLSYNENLQLIGTLTLRKDTSGSENDEGDGNNNDNSGNDNSGNDNSGNND